MKTFNGWFLLILGGILAYQAYRQGIDYRQQGISTDQKIERVGNTTQYFGALILVGLSLVVFSLESQLIEE